MRNARLMLLIMLALFLMPIVAYATPLESFAENPIPSWNEDSNGVNLDWDSTAQTVTFSNTYFESFADVSEWIQYEDEDTESFSTDGDACTFIANFTSDGAGAWDSWYTNNVSILDITGNFISMNYMVNNTNLLALQLYCYEQADHVGDYRKYQWPLYLAFTNETKDIDAFSSEQGNLTGIESIAIRLYGAVGDNVEFTTDSLRIGVPKLDNTYIESFADVDDWISGFGLLNLESDGNLLSFEYVGDNTYDHCYSSAPSIPNVLGYFLEYRVKTNASTKLEIGAKTGNGYIGTFYLIQPQVTVGDGWITNQVWIDADYALETISIHVHHTIAVKVEFDYIRIGARILDLNIGVPLESAITQSIEIMGNFSALESTVRFNITDSLFCDVNSTLVTFPDSTYAEFTNFARINFTLDEERIIFKIYVYDLNMTLINSYSSVVGPANNDYLFMTDSEFEGSYTLLYLQGDIGYLAEVIDTENIFYLLFLSLEMWGYLGPVMLVIVGYVLAKKEAFLGVMWFIVECLFVARYFELVEATPDYWWHILIILLGGLFTCIFPALLKRT